MDPIFYLIALVLVVGLIMWIVPPEEAMKSLIYKILTVVVVVVLIVWVLGILGVLPHSATFHLQRG